MTQQINLLEPALRPVRRWGRDMLLAGGALTAAVPLHYQFERVALARVLAASGPAPGEAIAQVDTELQERQARLQRDELLLKTVAGLIELPRRSAQCLRVLIAALPLKAWLREWGPPFLGRRRKVGWDLYGLLGIAKDDKERMHLQYGRNYQFFGAPVGLLFTLNRAMRTGSFVDYGMFLQRVSWRAARGRGLDTCPQVAFTQFGIRLVVCFRQISGDMDAKGQGWGHPCAVVSRRCVRVALGLVPLLAHGVRPVGMGWRIAQSKH